MELPERGKRNLSKMIDETQSPDVTFLDLYGTRFMMGELNLVLGMVYDSLHIFRVGVTRKIFASREASITWKSGIPHFYIRTKTGRKWAETYEWVLRDEPNVPYSYCWCLGMLGDLTGVRIDPGRMRHKVVRMLLEAMHGEAERRARIRSR